MFKGRDAEFLRQDELMFDRSGERPLEAASESTYVGHHPASGATAI